MLNREYLIKWGKFNLCLQKNDYTVLDGIFNNLSEKRYVKRSYVINRGYLIICRKIKLDWSGIKRRAVDGKPKRQKYITFFKGGIR